MLTWWPRDASPAHTKRVTLPNPDGEVGLSDIQRIFTIHP
jgi:hypothetical protein